MLLTQQFMQRVTLQPKVSVAALDDFNLDDDNSTDLLRTSMNKEQWSVQSKKKKKTQPTAVRKLVGKGNNVSTSIKAVTKESQRAGTSLWVVYIQRPRLKISLHICLIMEYQSVNVNNSQ